MDRRLIPHTQKIVEAEIASSLGKRTLDPLRPKERVAISDQRTLLEVDPRRILTGDVEVYDDRARNLR